MLKKEVEVELLLQAILKLQLLSQLHSQWSTKEAKQGK